MNLSASKFFLFLMEIYENEFKAIEETVSKDFFIPNLKNENE